MTYSSEAQHLIDAILAGDCCDECSAPSDQRHFDECSQHPENAVTPSWLQQTVANAERYAVEVSNPELTELRRENAALKRQVAGFHTFHGDCGAPEADWRERAERAETRVQELEAELQELQERDRDIAAGIEHRKGQCTYGCFG